LTPFCAGVDLEESSFVSAVDFALGVVAVGVLGAAASLAFAGGFVAAGVDS